MNAKLLLAAVAVSILGLANQAQAARPSHIDKLAHTAEVQTKQIKYYTQRYLMNQKNSRHLLNDLAQMQKLSAHIHGLAHQLKCRRPVLRHLRADVAKLDSYVHHVDRLVVSMKYDLNRKLKSLSRHNHHHHRSGIRVTIHNGHFHVTRSSRHGHGHNHNARAIASIRYQLSILKRIDSMIHKLEDTVHHLQADLRH